MKLGQFIVQYEALRVTQVRRPHDITVYLNICGTTPYQQVNTNVNGIMKTLAVRNI